MATTEVFSPLISKSGASTSIISTWYSIVATFPPESVTVHTTTVIPTGNSKPAKVAVALWLFTNVYVGQLSVTVAGSNSVPTVVYKQLLSGAFRVWFDTGAIIGTMMSTIVILKLHTAVFPLESVIVQTTVCTPASKTWPAKVVRAPPELPSNIKETVKLLVLSQLSASPIGSNSVPTMV